MNSASLTIVAKQNNLEIYLISYKHKESVGFVGDLEKGVRYADDKIHFIRKNGLWIDIRCSENVAKRILEKVIKLNLTHIEYTLVLQKSEGSRAKAPRVKP